MKKLFFVAGATMLAACGGQEATAPEANEANAAAAATEAPAEATPLRGTSWTFTRDGKEFQKSIDASGSYIVNSGDEHADHGTYALADGKHCFTSAMTDEGRVCWTTPASTAVGESVEITSDKGETVTVTRQEYVPLTMPS